MVRLLVAFAVVLGPFGGWSACTDLAPIDGAACNTIHTCPGGYGCAGGACRKLVGGPITSCSDDTMCPVGRCLVSTGFCVQCLEANDCVQSTCLPDIYQCGCQKNDDCATGRCNVATGTCLSCYADEQCDSRSCDRESGICSPVGGPIGSGDAGTEDAGGGAR